LLALFLAAGGGPPVEADQGAAIKAGLAPPAVFCMTFYDPRRRRGEGPFCGENRPKTAFPETFVTKNPVCRNRMENLKY
jgi:hypothetical protein